MIDNNKTAQPNMITILTNRKYRAGSLFLVFGAIIA